MRTVPNQDVLLSYTACSWLCPSMARPRVATDRVALSTSTYVPPKWDWRDTLTRSPPVRDQLGCGGCWAFASVTGVSITIHMDLPARAPMEFILLNLSSRLTDLSGLQTAVWSRFDANRP